MSIRKRRLGLALLAAALACLGIVASLQLASATPSAGTRALDHLPYSGTVTSGIPAFEVKQDGGGIAGRFEIRNPNSAAIALDGVSSGTGHALLAWNLGLGRGAVIITTNSANTRPALDVSSQSLGDSTLAAAADIRANNANATSPAVQMSSLGQNTLLQLNHRGPTGNLATFQTAGVNQAHLTRTGKGLFNGGVQPRGSGVAQPLEVEGSAGAYNPGDVLVVSDTTDRRVEKTSEAYSRRVIGVYVRDPGVLLTDRNVDTSPRGVPVAVVGLALTNVSAEGGTIRRGDLLVTSTTPGHAMRGTGTKLKVGTIIGKALAEFAGPGTGSIPVLVSLQ